MNPHAPTKSRVLVAGGTGAVGSRVVARLVADGHHVRTLSRDAGRAASSAARFGASEVFVADAMDRDAIAPALEGIDVVVSCLGANVTLRLRERRAYSALDPVANGHLLDAALATGTHGAQGVRRFVYLGVHTAPGYAETRYCVAHERFVARLVAAPIASTVVRPTGVFTALDDLVAMARLGVGSVIGDGRARTNPIHPDDVARALVEALDEGPADLLVGGPDVLTREAILGLAFDAVGKPLRAIHVPSGLFRLNAAMLGPFHPRLAELLEFAAAVSTHDAVAPAYGTHRLADWFAELAGRRLLASPELAEVSRTRRGDASPG